MEKVFIFGHKNPDTDSVTSAVALEYLKRKLGMNAEAKVLGEVNDETKFVFKYFNVVLPTYLNDTKLQIKNILYRKNLFVFQNQSILDTYHYMKENNTTGVPVVSCNKKFLGIITAKNILKKLFEEDDEIVNTSFENIIKSINGTPILKFNNEIKGNVKVVSYKSTTFLEQIKLSQNDILIVGDRHSIIEAAVNSKIKLLIITGGNDIKEEHKKIAELNKVNIIKTNLDTFKTIREFALSNYISTLLSNDRNSVVSENDYYDDFFENTKILGFNNYPVVDKKGVCKGLIRVTEINKKNRKKVILVDHNELEQSVDGISEAEVLEVIDHHKIGNISTNNPINFRNMIVGSTNTIVYKLYKESRVDIPKAMAGLMFSGILSDTLALTSPTTTDLDKKVIEELEKILKINYKEYAEKMFKASINFENKTIRDLINADIKTFDYKDKTFKVSQVILMSADRVLNKKAEIIEELEKTENESKSEFVILMITDVLKKGSYLYYSTGAKEIINLIYEGINNGKFVKNCISRKKQIIPQIMEIEQDL